MGKFINDSKDEISKIRLLLKIYNNISWNNIFLYKRRQ